MYSTLHLNRINFLVVFLVEPIQDKIIIIIIIIIIYYQPWLDKATNKQN